MKAAIRADEPTEGKNAAIIDTLARVHFDMGHIGRAFGLQRIAVDLADERIRGELLEALEKDQAAAEDLEFH